MYSRQREPYDSLGADVATPARPVLYHELLPEPLRQPLANSTRRNVGRPASRERHNEAHRPRRPGLRVRDPRDRRQRGNVGGKMQKLSSVGKFQVALPMFSRNTRSIFLL